MSADDDKVKQLLQNAPEEHDDEPDLPEDLEEIQKVKPHGRAVLHWLAAIIVVLMLVLGGLVGWFWWRDSQDDTSQQAAVPDATETEAAAEEQQETGVCPEDFVQYESEERNIAFCYPETWGEVAQADATYAATDTGDRWRLLFSDNPDVNMGLVSDDWSTNEPRDGACVDPAVQTLPDIAAYTDDWTVETEADTNPPQPSSAHRSLDIQSDAYYVVEEVDDLLTDGVCIRGYVMTGDETYPLAAVSYVAGFTEDVATPQQHMDEPNTLITTDEREAFNKVVASIQQYSDDE